MSKDARRSVMLIRLCALLAALVAGAGLVHAGSTVPPTITQVGRLVKMDGSTDSSTVTMKFSLYDSTASTTSLWTETQSVTLDDGYFSVQLGSVVPFGSVWDGTTRFLGLTVNSDSEMTPREEITSVPYALVA